MRKGSDIKVAHVVHCSTEHPDTIGSQACFRWHLCLSALLGETESVSTCLATPVLAPWALQWKNAHAGLGYPTNINPNPPQPLLSHLNRQMSHS